MDTDEKKLTTDERAAIIKANRAEFANAGVSAVAEFDDTSPCLKCNFLRKDCHKTCGIIMKYVSAI